MPNHTIEAADILTRVLESLARASHKTLKQSTRDDIRRACELLSQGGEDYDLLDDLLETVPPRRSTPGERVTAVLARDQVDAADDDPGYQTWRQRRRYQGEG